MFDFLDNKLKHGDKEMNRESGKMSQEEGEIVNILKFYCNFPVSAVAWSSSQESVSARLTSVTELQDT